MSNNNNDRFLCVAIDSKIYEADEKKAAQIGVKLRVIEGPDTGREIFWYGSLHENAQQYTAQTLRDLGWSCNDIATLTGLGTTKVWAVQKDEEYKGKIKTRFMVFPMKSAKATLADADKGSFAKQYKALALSVPAAALTDDNRAPAVIPEPAATNGARTTATGASATAVPF